MERFVCDAAQGVSTKRNERLPIRSYPQGVPAERRSQYIYAIGNICHIVAFYR
jgi:hypothetical protein